MQTPKPSDAALRGTEARNVLWQKFYVHARQYRDGTAFGLGYMEITASSPEEALAEAQKQPWAEGALLGVTPQPNISGVTKWVPAERQFTHDGKPVVVPS